MPAISSSTELNAMLWEMLRAPRGWGSSPARRASGMPAAPNKSSLRNKAKLAVAPTEVNHKSSRPAQMPCVRKHLPIHPPVGMVRNVAGHSQDPRMAELRRPRTRDRADCA